MSIHIHNRQIRPIILTCLFLSVLNAGDRRLTNHSNHLLTTQAASIPTISFVQSNYAVPTGAQAVNVTFVSPQAPGDLNVVVVGWRDTTAVVTSVSDTTGNSYNLAAGPTLLTGHLSQSIYYAKNVIATAAGANTVTVAFSAAANSPDIRILEYSGADLANPVDVTAAQKGNSPTCRSGGASTTSPTDLIFGANTLETWTSNAGPGFTWRINAYPDGEIAEDRTVTATGTYGASASLITSGRWIMQMVAFRTPGSGGGVTPPPAPTNLAATAASPSQINLSWAASAGLPGSAVTYLIERCQSAGCTNFLQIGTTTATSYSDGGLTASTSYSYRIRASAAGQLSSYSNVASASTPAVAIGSLSVNPSSTNFGNVAFGSSVAKTLVLSNTGNANVTISQANVSGSAFSLAGLSVPSTLGAGQNLTLGVTFTPGAYGPVAGYITFISNASNPSLNETLSGTGTHTVGVSWQPSTSTVAGYNIYRGTAVAGPYAKVNSSLITGSNYVDPSVQAGQTYYYVATAVDSNNNESAYSNQATATIPTP